MNYIQERWTVLASKYSSDKELIDHLYNEIAKSYDSGDRYYHNLTHIESLLRLSDQYQNKLLSKEILDFSIFYHDIIYRAGMQDNEQQSAFIAKKALAALGVSIDVINQVSLFIETTKDHQPHNHLISDLLYFLDFDLSILAADNETYKRYRAAVRKEFSFVNDAAFAAGRSAFLSSMLSKPHIFLTEDFQKQYEAKARQNIMTEIEGYRAK